MRGLEYFGRGFEAYFREEFIAILALFVAFLVYQFIEDTQIFDIKVIEPVNNVANVVCVNIAIRTMIIVSNSEPKK